MQQKIRTFKDKVRDAVQAFRGKQCKDCEYKKIFEQCFKINDCDKDLMESLADKMERVNVISPEELRKTLEIAEKRRGE